jgi:hypothetical protein
MPGLLSEEFLEGLFGLFRLASLKKRQRLPERFVDQGIHAPLFPNLKDAALSFYREGLYTEPRLGR